MKYCLNCRKEIEDNSISCECGCRSFIIGNNITLGKKCVECKCGDSLFCADSHIDFNNKLVDRYECENCGNIIEVETYRILN